LHTNKKKYVAKCAATFEAALEECVGSGQLPEEKRALREVWIGGKAIGAGIEGRALGVRGTGT
jgi:hypothetical protein